MYTSLLTEPPSDQLQSMHLSEANAEEPAEALSDSSLEGASPIALLSALGPWLQIKSVLSGTSEIEADGKLRQRAQKLLINRILWCRATETANAESKKALPLISLALSFGKKEDVRLQAGEAGWDMTPREAAALLATVPDRAGQHAPKLLQPKYYFPNLVQSCLAALTKRWQELFESHGAKEGVCKIAQHDGTFEFVAQLLIKLSRRGQADYVAAGILTSFLSSSTLQSSKTSTSSKDPSSALDGMWQAIMSLVSTDAAATERFTEALLQDANRVQLNDSSAEVLLWSLFGKLLWSSPSVRQLFTERLLVQRTLPHRCLRWLVRFVIVNPLPNLGSDKRSEPGRILEQIGKVWGAPDFVRSAPLQQQSYISAALALGISGLGKDGLEQAPELLSSLLQGVSTRLDSPIWDTRVLGMKVATVFSTVLDPANPLVFDEEVDFKGDEDWTWQSWNTEPKNEQIASKQLEKERKAWERETMALLNDFQGSGNGAGEETGGSSERDGGATASISGRAVPSRNTRPDLTTTEDADSLEEIVLPGGLTPSGKTGPKSSTPRPLIEELPGDEEPDSDDDSVASLQPYDLDDDMEDLDGGKVPTQLRECAAALRKKDDWEAVEKALSAAEGLIRADPDELQDVSIELVRALLHVRVSEFSMDSEEDLHEERRYKALVALLAHATAPVVTCLTSEVRSPHLDVHQRLLIMDVMQAAAQELSGLQSATITDTSPSTPPELPLNPTPWKEVEAPATPWSHSFERELPLKASQKRIGKARYWGKTDREKRDKVLQKNRFTPFAAAFMLPLMKDFDKKTHGVDWLERDFLVLGRFLHLLGSLVEFSAPSLETQPLAAALMDLLQSRAISGHQEPYVRRQALFAAASVLMALAPAQVIAALVGDHSPVGDGLDWLRAWAAEVAEKDSDETCRGMAEACLQLQSNLAARAMELIQAGSPASVDPALLASVSSGAARGPSLVMPGSQVRIQSLS